jgi:hypothetical protein
MKDLPEVISRRAWFLLFNVGATIYAIATGALRWDAPSIISYGWLFH